MDPIRVVVARVRPPARSSSQVSAKSGVFLHVESDSGDDMPSLTVVESVRCLECGAVYAKPAGGGTVRDNPGCPECGYVGWVAAGIDAAFSEAWPQRHFVGDPRQHPRG
jgi:hypothetical protein